MQFNIIKAAILLATGSQMVLAGAIPEKSNKCAELPTGPLERCTVQLTDEGKKNITALKTALSQDSCPGYTGKAQLDEATGIITTEYPKDGVKSLLSDPDSKKYFKLIGC